jgi:hypothetical protein
MRASYNEKVVMTQESDKKMIGRAEKISFPELSLDAVYARIDTGAKTSSIWASSVTERDGVLDVVFFDTPSAHHTGKPVVFEEYDRAIVASSTGHTQVRFKVRLLVTIKGKKIRAWFTLADRSTQVYPVLIGRNVLLGKFVVDVKQGRVLKDEESQRTQALKSKMDEEKS